MRITIDGKPEEIKNCLAIAILNSLVGLSHLKRGKRSGKMLLRALISLHL